MEEQRARDHVEPGGRRRPEGIVDEELDSRLASAGFVDRRGADIAAADFERDAAHRARASSRPGTSPEPVATSSMRTGRPSSRARFGIIGQSTPR